jgi:hypothetical protein
MSLIVWKCCVRWLLLGVFATAAATAAAAQPRVLEFPVIDRDFQRYQTYLAGRQATDVGDFAGPAMSRHVAELWLFAVAPVLGGCGCRIDYRPYGVETTNARSLADVVSGRQASDPVAGFASDVRYTDQIAFSDEILGADGFVVGFYTHRSRADVLGLRSADALRRLRFAVGAHWQVDRQVLARRGWQAVPADDWPSALRQIRAGRADVILQPFAARADLALASQGLEAEFVPVPGFRAVFGHARHFAFSTRHPDGPALRTHFNRGLALLRQDGRLAALWRAAGVDNPQTASWAWVP